MAAREICAKQLEQFSSGHQNFAEERLNRYCHLCLWWSKRKSGLHPEAFQKEWLDSETSDKHLSLGLDSLISNAGALLDSFVSLKKKIPQVFLPLMSPLLKKINAVFGPGLTYITWTSLKLPEYLDTVRKALKHLEHVINQVADIKTSCIDKILDEISRSVLIEFPTTKPWTAVELIENTRTHCAMIASVLNQKILGVKQAVQEVIHLFALEIHKSTKNNREDDIPEERSQITNENLHVEKHNEKPRIKGIPSVNFELPEVVFCDLCHNLLDYFGNRVAEGILHCTKQSLNVLRRKVFKSMIGASRSLRSNSSHEEIEEGFSCALFQCKILLEIPQVVIYPSLDDIQQAINRSVQLIMNVSQNVISWEKTLVGIKTSEGDETSCGLSNQKCSPRGSRRA
ncbi:dynein axonemal heavy chain 8-like [Tachypleus tridentatus]|uniref:dynein axonemal heavy chain 8-like n=1 Tax=Tachypleus tridentatus TaxID=6853 RepID=UPI003FD1AEE0